MPRSDGINIYASTTLPLPKPFARNQNNAMSNSNFDLKARAHQAMIDAGFKPDFSPEVRAEVQVLQKGPVKDPPAGVRDLRSLPWSSIDNDSSRDLDQVEYVEKLQSGGTRLLVGIAD